MTAWMMYLPWKTLLSVSWLESLVPLYTSLEQYGTNTEEEVEEDHGKTWKVTFIKVVKCWVFGWVVAANIIAQPRVGEVQIGISRG